jgi:hypothetical protein
MNVCPAIATVPRRLSWLSLRSIAIVTEPAPCPDDADATAIHGAWLVVVHEHPVCAAIGIVAEPPDASTRALICPSVKTQAAADCAISIRRSLTTMPPRRCETMGLAETV